MHMSTGRNMLYQFHTKAQLMLWHFVILVRVQGRFPVQQDPAYYDQICPIFSCLVALTSHDECSPQKREKQGMLLLMFSINNPTHHRGFTHAPFSSLQQLNTQLSGIVWNLLFHSSQGIIYFYQPLFILVISSQSKSNSQTATALQHIAANVSFVHFQFFTCYCKKSRVNNQERD